MYYTFIRSVSGWGRGTLHAVSWLLMLKLPAITKTPTPKPDTEIAELLMFEWIMWT